MWDIPCFQDIVFLQFLVMPNCNWYPKISYAISFWYHIRYRWSDAIIGFSDIVGFFTNCGRYNTVESTYDIVRDATMWSRFQINTVTSNVSGFLNSTPWWCALLLLSLYFFFGISIIICSCMYHNSIEIKKGFKSTRFHCYWSLEHKMTWISIL